MTQIMKQTKMYATALTMLLLLVTFPSCDKSDTPALKKQSVEIKLNTPLGIDGGEYSDKTLSVKSLADATTTDFADKDIVNNAVTVELYPGKYEVTFAAKMAYVDAQGVRKQASIRATQELVVATSTTPIVFEVKPNYTPSTSGFVIEEVFFTSTLTPEGKSYFGSKDQYIKVYNNSEDVLYADGLTLLVSAFLTVQKREYRPDIMNEAMAVDAIYVIPGDGDDHPIQPGQTILIANDAIDHTTVNANSVDLSKADYEWFDESTNPKVVDNDNPAVPNLIRYYSDSKTIYSIHNRGFRSIAIARMPVTAQEYLAQYKYDYEYTFVHGDFTKVMTQSAYKIPNTWLLDVVNISTKTDFQWILVPASIDSGFTYCLEKDGDKAHGYSVIRKTESTVGSRKVLKDTNNSTEDFTPKVKASLLK